MPFDLWIRSAARPVVFEPERIPLAPIASRYEAEQVAVGYTSADREVLVVEIDDAGKIVSEPLSADELNHMAQGSEAVRGPSIIRPDGSATPVAIALGTSGEIVDVPGEEAADDAALPDPKEVDAMTTTRYDSSMTRRQRAAAGDGPGRK